MTGRTPTRLLATLGLALTIAVRVSAQDVRPALSANTPAPSGRTGAQLYQAACATCHGPDGRGLPRSHVGFEIELPDFTDCSFATPEADVDWFAIIHQGGPVRAFDRRMPAFGEALADDDIRAVLAHVRSFCADRRWPRGELNLPRPLVTEKAFPENESVLTTTVATAGGTAVGNTFLYERRIGARSQWELSIPFEVQESESGSRASGLGDVALALKHALWHNLERGTIVSVAGEVVLPTGKETNGLGKGVTIFEPFVAVGQILPADSFLQTQAGVELPADRQKAEREAFWRIAGGRTFAQGRFGRAWTPMIELLASRELAAGEEIKWDVLPQIQVSLSRRQHILFNAGLQLPVNEREGRGRRFMMYVLWDWFDGGLFDGW